MQTWAVPGSEWKKATCAHRFCVLHSVGYGLGQCSGVFLAPSGQQHTNASPPHDWDALCVWGTKGSIESPPHVSAGAGRVPPKQGRSSDTCPRFSPTQNEKEHFSCSLLQCFVLWKKKKKSLISFLWNRNKIILIGAPCRGRNWWAAGARHWLGWDCKTGVRNWV